MVVVECKINNDLFNVDSTDYKILLDESVPLIFSYLGDSILKITNTEFYIYNKYPDDDDLLEHQLFIWKACHDLGDDSFKFEGCKLTAQIGPFEIGDVIPSIVIDCKHSQLTIFDITGRSIYTTKLKLSIA